MSRGACCTIAAGVGVVVAALAFRAGRRTTMAGGAAKRGTPRVDEVEGPPSPPVPPNEAGPADFADWEQAVPPRDS